MLVTDVVFCGGAMRDHPEDKQTEAALDQQLIQGFAGLLAETFTRLSIAYEPVWTTGILGHLAPLPGS